jgi:hypothetical protein
LSETAKLSSKDVKSWLERETGSIFTPVHANAQKLLNEMRKDLENLADSSKMLLDNSGKEIEKRNMKTYGRARALNKLARLFVDRIRQIKVPGKISYDSFNEFVQETQKAFMATDVDIRNWFPRISPFFILDRRKFQIVFERAKETLKEMNAFLTKEYVKTKTLEETFQLTDKLKILEGQLSNLKEQKAKAEDAKALVEKEIADIHQKMADLKSKGGISQLDQTSMEIDTLSNEVKHALHHLQKPFIKLQSLSLHGEGSGMTPEEVGKLNQYLANPLEALATEEAGYPLLKQILEKLARLMVEGKLKLKSDKMRKAEQAIESINKNSLENLHKKCADAIARKKQLSVSAEVTETKSHLLKLNEHLENLSRRRNSVESEVKTLERAHNETLEKIRNNKSQIEKNIFTFMGKKIHVE